MNRYRILFFILFIQGISVYPQQSYLSRRITMECHDCRLETVLKEVGNAANFRFSYDAGMIQPERRVSLQASNAKVDEVLEQLLGRNIKVREIGNHVIIVKKKPPEKEAPQPLVITGFVRNATSQKPLAEVTVYDITRKRSALTAADGSFTIEIPAIKGKPGLSISRRGYRDTVIFTAGHSVNILLHPVVIERIVPASAIIPEHKTDSLPLVKWIVPRETMINSRNLEDRTLRTFQASIIPYIGTNWRITGSVTSRFSFNLLAGYTGGLKGFELGGLLNITAGKMEGIQIGGLGNIVGGHGKGWQVAGIFNLDLARFSGVQIAGIFNYTPDTIAGVQIGGLTNIVTGKMSGLQIGGLMNLVTEDCESYQIAGLTNLDLKNSEKMQIAGLYNQADDAGGVQIAGLVNVAAKYNSGLQIAGLVNYASHLRGVQIGFINIAGKRERGVPIGFFSWVGNGYHVAELSGNEIFYGNVAYKSGTRSFYNFFQFGMGSDYKFQGSYGIGTIISLGRKFSVNVDASAGFVYHPVDIVYHGLLLKGNPALEYRFARHFAIFGGPSYNFFLFPKGDPSATSRGLSTYDFYFRSTENASIQMWIGAVIGIRF